LAQLGDAKGSLAPLVVLDLPNIITGKYHQFNVFKIEILEHPTF